MLTGDDDYLDLVWSKSFTLSLQQRQARRWELAGVREEGAEEEVCRQEDNNEVEHEGEAQGESKDGKEVNMSETCETVNRDKKCAVLEIQP